MSTRTLRIYGEYDPGTQIIVTINGMPADNVLAGDLLYSFNTSTEVHGRAITRIEVVRGKIVLGKITATYPALINNVEGWATFIQPMATPLITYTDRVNAIPKNLTVHALEAVQFDHLMLNGASRLVVTSPETIVPGGELYVGDLRKHLPEGVSIYPEYTYSPQPNKFNQEDFEKLVASTYQ